MSTAVVTERETAARVRPWRRRLRRLATGVVLFAATLSAAYVVITAYVRPDIGLWMKRYMQKAWNRVTDQERIAFLWGPICRFATPIPSGYAAGIGFSIAELVPDADGRLSIASSIDVGNSTHAGLSRGDRVYAAAGWEGLITIDASRRGHMREIRRDKGAGYALSIAMGKDHLYLSFKEQGGLAVYRLRDRDRPELVRKLLEGESYAQVLVHGERLYAVGAEKLLIFDLADPSNPALLSVLDVPYQVKPKPTDPMPRHVAVAGDLVYLSHGALGLLTVDARDPRAPRLVGRWDGIDFCDWVHVDGTRAYAASEGTPIRVADVSEPLTPRWIGQLDLAAAPQPPSRPFDDPSLLPLAFGPRGVFVLDTRAAGLPALAYTKVPTPYFHRVKVIDDQAYATAASHGLHVYSLEDPAHPRSLGVLRTEGLARGLLVVNDELWIADVLGWLLITKPVRGGLPERITAADQGGHAWDVDVVGDLVYLANSQVGFGVLKREGDHFKVEDETFTGGYTLEVAGRGPYAYVGTVGEGVVVFRADETPPRRVAALKWGTLGPLRIGPVATAVTVHEDRLYVGTPRGEVRAYDLTRPEDPELLWTRDVGGSVFEIVVEPGGLWVSAGPAGVAELALNGSPPRVLGRWEVPGSAMSTARYKDRVLVAAGEAGVVSLPIVQ